MKCSIVGCSADAVFHDEVPETLKKRGIKPAAFCHEHRQNQSKFGSMLEQLAKRRRKAPNEGEN